MTGIDHIFDKYFWICFAELNWLLDGAQVHLHKKQPDAYGSISMHDLTPKDIFAQARDSTAHLIPLYHMSELSDETPNSWDFLEMTDTLIEQSHQLVLKIATYCLTSIDLV